MPRNIVFIICIFFILVAPKIIYSAPFDNSLQYNLDQALDSTRQHYSINAIALSVYLPQSHFPVNITSGTYSKSDLKPITENNLFQVASITKIFIAATLLKLQTENKIHLTDKIGQWFPKYPNWKDITVQELLAQTSGIANYIDSPNWWQNLTADPKKIWGTDELLQMSYQLKPYFVPGTNWHYSNTNYLLAGLIIEKITGNQLSDELNTRFFKPLNLTNTFYLPTNPSSDISQRLVHGYDGNNDATNQNTSWLYGAGAIISNPADLAKWAHVLFHQQVLNTAEMQQMLHFISLTTAQPLKNFTETGYGLGIFTMNTPYGIMWFTPGLSAGYTSILVYMPCDNISFAYSASTNAYELKKFHPYLLTKIMDAILKDPQTHRAIEKYQHSPLLPGFCKNNLPTSEFNFPKI